MTMTHHINHVRYKKGLEGHADGITSVRVANNAGLLDFPIEEVIARIQHGESFDIWAFDRQSNSFFHDEVELLEEPEGLRLRVPEERLLLLPSY